MTKYAKALGLEYLDKENKLNPVVMGCYGFGLERCMASIVEQHNDENGIVWPMSVAPYHVAVVPVQMKNEEQVALAERIYAELKAAGIDAVLDNRDERVGVKFKDMELIGLPYRVTVGKKAGEGIVEFTTRKTGEKVELTIEELMKKFEK